MLKIIPLRRAIPEGQFVSPAPAHPAEHAALLTAAERRLHELVNEYRREQSGKAGRPTLRPLIEDWRLGHIARWYAYDCAKVSRVGHRDSRGRNPERRVMDARYPIGGFDIVGENMGRYYWAETAEENAQKRLALWKESPGHNKMMLRPELTHHGIGAAVVDVPGGFFSSTQRWFFAVDLFVGRM